MRAAAGPDIVLDYEPSLNPDLTIYTDVQTPWTATQQVLGLARRLRLSAGGTGRRAGGRGWHRHRTDRVWNLLAQRESQRALAAVAPEAQPYDVLRDVPGQRMIHVARLTEGGVVEREHHGAAPDASPCESS